MQALRGAGLCLGNGVRCEVVGQERVIRAFGELVVSRSHLGGFDEEVDRLHRPAGLRRRT